jgi:hypothetical protein
VPPTRNHASKVLPRPVAPPCPFCEKAVWRFNGRSWYAADRVNKKRHVCTARAAVAYLQDTESIANGKARLSAVHKQVVLVAALAGLAGLYAAARAMRR